MNGNTIPPMPVIVGSPRSGTTLLRFMLDAHPLLAIPPETGFLGLGSRLVQGEASPRDNFLHALINFPPDAPGWHDFAIDESQFRAELEKIDPFEPAEGLRAFYRIYAMRFGKPRWGDKTPMHCRDLLAIQGVLPEAHFIHLVRDGRDAAVSLRECWFSPGSSIEIQASYWRDNVLAARNQGADCSHYMEVRYEDLIRDTHAQLRRICEFVELDFDATQLDYHKRASLRLAEHLGRRRIDGSGAITHEQRLWAQRGTREPPDANRIGAWKAALNEDENAKFAAIAGDALELFGYRR